MCWNVGARISIRKPRLNIAYWLDACDMLQFTDHTAANTVSVDSFLTVLQSGLLQSRVISKEAVANVLDSVEKLISRGGKDIKPIKDKLDRAQYYVQRNQFNRMFMGMVR